MRKLITAILARDSSIEVVGTAMDGAFALKKIQELQPDVVTLDLEMPRMDGMEMLRLIMRSAPLPIILFSTHSKEGGYATMKALALGAVDFLAKPKDAAAGHLEDIADQLIAKIKLAKRAAQRKLPPVTVPEELPGVKKPARPAPAPRHGGPFRRPARQWAPAVRGRAFPFGRAGIQPHVRWRGDDRHGRRRCGRPWRDQGRRRHDHRAK